ncbi:4936_t:CDS:2, partial [Racocetra fulgida]
NIEETFQMPKGWASPANAKFGKKGGGQRIKANVQFFLNGNLNPKDKMTAKEMLTTIQNWIGRYSREFDQQETAIALETFKAVSSPNEEN